MTDGGTYVTHKEPWPDLCEVCGGHVERLELWQELTDGGLIYGHRACAHPPDSDGTVPSLGDGKMEE